jgi:dTDP-glucose 4,6-dehydratase
MILMNVLVTGGCGFIGSNFINYYYQSKIKSEIKSEINNNIKSEINIVCLDAMYYCASLNNINEEVRNSPRFKFIKGNLCSFDLVKHILVEHKITHVIHFAAQSHVDNSFHQSFQYTQDNVVGTHTLLEAIRDTDLNIFLLHFSTDEVYGESLHNEMKNEQSILCPTNPYSASKAAAEMYVYSYIYSFKLKAIITRGNNVYGPNQYPEKLIPKFIELLKNNKKCTIAGKGESIRNFIHVYDVCTAVDIIINKGILGEVYNIGGDHSNEYNVMDVAKKLIKLIKKTDNNNHDDYHDYIEYIPDRPFNDTRYFISNDKLTNLGWEQKIMFDEGLKMLFD